MPDPVNQEQPYQALDALRDGFLRIAPIELRNWVNSEEALSDDLRSPELARKIVEDPEWKISTHQILRLSSSGVMVLDQEAGTAHCHTLTGFALPPSGGSTEVPVTLDSENDGLCGQWVAAISVDGTAALLAESDWVDSIDMTTSRIRIAMLHGTEFDPPCGVNVRYAITFQAASAYCDRYDCALVMRRAVSLAARRHAGEDATALGAGAILPDAPARLAEYQKMKALAEVPGIHVLPGLGAVPKWVYDTFEDDVVFPIDLDDGKTYLARLGFGALGSHDSPDNLFAVYRLDGDDLVPFAGVMLRATRDKIISVESQPLAR